MSTTNGGSSDSIFAELESFAGRIDSELVRLENERAQIGLEIARLRTLQRALEREPKPKAAKAKTGKATPSRLGTEATRRVVQAMLASDGTFTAQNIAERSETPRNALYSTMRELREHGFIGKAGIVPNPNGAGKHMDAWRVLDRAAGEALLEA